MKRIIPVAVFLCVLVFPGMVSKAAVGTIGNQQIQIREEIDQQQAEMLQERVNEATTGLQERAENLIQKRQEIRARITAKLQEKKQQIVERIQTMLTSINTRRTEHFTRVLDRLAMILERVISRADKLKSEGEDVSEVETAYAAARIAIVDARTAIEEQAAKDYQLIVDDETTAKNDIGTTMKTLQNDLQETNLVVKAARDAVHSAILALVRVRPLEEVLPSVSETETPTHSIE